MELMERKRRKQHKDKRPDELAYGHKKSDSALQEMQAAAELAQPQGQKDEKPKPQPDLVASFNIGKIDVPDIDLNDILGIEEDPTAAEPETRYLKPRRCKVKHEHVMYENAEQLARELRLDKGERADCLVAGSFIFGDFIEAYLRTQHAKAKRMIITTLSLSENNIDSLHNLLTRNYIDQLDMLVSTYFFANEYHGLVKYLYQELDIENKFQLAVADIHTKTCQFETLGGRHIVMHGSANLRSSANIEQFCIEENEELYRFYENAFVNLIENYKTINKPCRGLRAFDTMSIKKFD